MSRRIKRWKDTRNRGRPYLVRWSDGIDLATGKVKWSQESFRYKLDADRFAAEKKLEPPDSSAAADPGPGMTLGRFLREWTGTRNTTDYQPGTRTLDQNTIARLLEYFGPRRPLQEIDPMQAAQFVAGLSRLDGQAKPLSAWSRARTLRNVKTIFNAAVEWELIEKNPFAGIKRPKLPESNWHYLTPDEFHGLLNASSGKHTVPLRCKVLYALAYCCGLRLGEILSLKWDNLRFRTGKGQAVGGTVHIRNRPGAVDEPPFTIKDKEQRTIDIPKRCLELLLDLRAYNEMTDQTPYVVLDQQHYRTMLAKWRTRRQEKRPWQNHDVQNNTLARFKRHVAWAKVTPDGSLALHTLRKTCITNWANAISNPEVVRTLAGHADIKTTMAYYSKVTQDQRRKAAEVVDRLLETGLTTATGTYEG